MHNMRLNIKKTMAALAVLLVPAVLSAQTAAAPAAPAADDQSMGFNVMLVTLVGFMLLLLFAIGVLGSVLKQLSLAYRDKIRADRKKAAPIVKTIALLVVATLLSATSFAADAGADAATAAAPVVQWQDKLISGIPAFDFYMLVGFIMFELVVIFAMLIVMRVLIKQLRATPESEAAEKAIARIPFWDKFNAAVAVEQEQDVMLDHDYDGIRELDNALPPWWKYGFYLTIIVSFIYIYRYHVSGTGPSSYEEYVAEVEKGEHDKAEYLAKSANNVDENTVELSKDAADIAAGQNVFQTTCAACHAKDGGGGVGPNLTDEYWLHGGGIKDVFKSIKYGWPDKGMKSWKDDFSPRQIAQIASYVVSLKGTKPAAPKDKQGELYIESGNAPKPADSAATATDSAKAKVAVK